MSSLSNFVKRIRDIMRNDAGINGDAQRIEQLAWMLFLKIYDAREDDWEIDDDNYQSVNMDSETCIDDIDVQALIEDGVIKLA